jgi:hypothetical protein
MRVLIEKGRTDAPLFSLWNDSTLLSRQLQKLSGQPGAASLVLMFEKDENIIPVLILDTFDPVSENLFRVVDATQA